jgi:hypothetical protein
MTITIICFGDQERNLERAQSGYRIDVGAYRVACPVASALRATSACVNPVAFAVGDSRSWPGTAPSESPLCQRAPEPALLMPPATSLKLTSRIAGLAQ